MESDDFLNGTDGGLIENQAAVYYLGSVNLREGSIYHLGENIKFQKGTATETVHIFRLPLIQMTYLSSNHVTLSSLGLR